MTKWDRDWDEDEDEDDDDDEEDDRDWQALKDKKSDKNKEG